MKTPSFYQLQRVKNAVVYINGGNCGSGFDTVAATWGGVHYAVAWSVPAHKIVEWEVCDERETAEQLAAQWANGCMC